MLLGEQSFVRITLFIAVLSCNWGRGDVFSSFGIVMVSGMGMTSECRDIRDGSHISLYMNSAMLWCSRGVIFFLRCSVTKGAIVLSVIKPIGTCWIIWRL